MRHFELGAVIKLGRPQAYVHRIQEMKDLGAIAANLGIDSALNLDGGGSVTLSIATQNGSTILNSPIQ
jgi:exopolysaccharide biosynthesis protein